MKLTIRYFAQLKQSAGVDQEVLHNEQPLSAAQLYQQLQQHHGFGFEPAALRVAINGAFADWGAALQDGDEIAFLPPFSGG